jgi:hypothetical protein
MSLYVNGALIQAVQVVFCAKCQFSRTNEYWQISRQYGIFLGAVYSFMLYTRALSGIEIAQNFNVLNNVPSSPNAASPLAITTYDGSNQSAHPSVC